MSKVVSHIVPGDVPLGVDQVDGKGTWPGEGDEFSQQSARLQLRKQKHMENGAEKVTGEHELIHHPGGEGVIKERCFESVRVCQPGEQIEEDDEGKADDRMNAAAQLRLFQNRSGQIENDEPEGTVTGGSAEEAEQSLNGREKQNNSSPCFLGKFHDTDQHERF